MDFWSEHGKSENTQISVHEPRDKENRKVWSLIDVNAAQLPQLCFRPISESI
jgi:hypothetical protein